MIYLYTEDTKEGLSLMKLAESIYSVDTASLFIDSFGGIFNIVDHIKCLSICPDDKVYYVYDNIEGNTDIPINIKKATNQLIKLNIQKQVELIPIVCCEYSILTAKNMNLFIHTSVQRQCMILGECNKNKLTTETKR